MPQNPLQQWQVWKGAKSDPWDSLGLPMLLSVVRASTRRNKAVCHLRIHPRPRAGQTPMVVQANSGGLCWERRKRPAWNPKTAVLARHNFAYADPYPCHLTTPGKRGTAPISLRPISLLGRLATRSTLGFRAKKPMVQPPHCGKRTSPMQICGQAAVARLLFSLNGGRQNLARCRSEITAWSMELTLPG
ncbi:uncharacterized protein B0I36DRAFT_347010 [Microdochium trichocladiopsis]|uniref:Uncharacterized protein n=1 Tax=Microdochium trichocladiopsis TaxID=1682393 RepID=A0A9P9BT24_9PEZI|nr:uncharacterized protein B0I36DRAFT_347010 [Microdochium trichocladiopsis]KAH7035189.1 hypothetical protein B0I36DRAFT_347010 [Microdochium trichocladiopsis]